MGMGFSRAPPEDSSSSSRSLFTRFLPLRPVKRTLDDFHIQPDEPHRTYSAGDHVHGAVVLVITKPIRITHLVVALHGFVRVFKSPNTGADQPLVPSSAAPIKGYAPLFNDEQTLTSDGRLDPGRYEFKFNLLFPTDVALPSSIDFERGTVSYNITATLTRPTKIAPTIQCDRKVSLVEKVDVGLLNPPRPRTIFLEPISKKTRRKKPARTDRHLPAAREPTVDQSSDVDSVGRSVLSEDPSQRPQSIARTNSEHVDARSLFSGDSNYSASTGLSLTPADVLSQTSNPPGVRGASLAQLQEVDAKTITTTIELLKGGCLPGDIIPLKITVQHIKRIRSMHGVIVTLYRQGRIDPKAPQPSPSNASGMDLHSTTSRESHSRATTRTYRKDLCQTVAPLIIDPVSLGTSVSASVKVPEDAFPTIKHVPGDMISFRYHLEVIVDLGGKLEGQLQSSGAGPQTRFGAFAANGSGEGGNTMYTSWSTNVINTEHLRREKGVIYDGFELILGTLDSSRLRGKTSSKRTMYHPNASATSQEEASSPMRRDAPGYVTVNGDHHPSPRIPSRNYSTPPPPLREDLPAPELYEPDSPPPPPPPVEATAPPDHLSHDGPAPAYIPPPNLPDVNTLSEKERVRLQEQRLLPSQPPQSASDAGPSAPGPSAPETSGSGPSAPLEDNIYDADDGPSALPHEPPETEPSAPTLDDVEVPPPSQGHMDKLEIERQRLLNEASAPPEFPDDARASGSGAGTSAQQEAEEPSAPAFSEEDEYGAHFAYSAAGQGGAGPSEPLPRYER